LKEKERKKIIIDSREKNSMVPSYLIGKGVNFIFEKLDVGDYIVGDVVIERKSAADFFSSIYSGRLKIQLSNMVNIKNKILLIEGVSEYKKFNKNILWGNLINYSVFMNIPFIFVENEKETVDFILYLSSKRSNFGSTRCKKNIKTLYDKKIFFIQGIPGIGERYAKKLLEKFGSVKNLFLSSKDKLCEILSEKVVNEMISIID
jgi:ERCC4-type nuclease